MPYYKVIGTPKSEIFRQPVNYITSRPIKAESEKEAIKKHLTGWAKKDVNAYRWEAQKVFEQFLNKDQI